MATSIVKKKLVLKTKKETKSKRDETRIPPFFEEGQITT